MKFSCALETSSERIRLVNVISPLIKAGYQLVSQKQEPSENGGNIIHVVARSQGSKTQADLVDDLSSIAGCTLFNLEISDEETEAPTKKAMDEKDVLATIGAQYPNIVNVVNQYADSLADNKRATALHELGRKVGGGIYQRDYALGSPLKKSVAISRELVPALKSFAKVKANENMISLIRCPFCGSSTSSHSSCDFVVGYIEGFLTANPAVGKASVEETSCGAGGNNTCEFNIR
ncbi:MULTISPECIES: hypothetical protein [unclassified Psychrobacter]|uniref:hypothetical protein n=1 Tax=unclassified Psychrobacter TaxID=196806 RepID=UPI003F472E1D